jgi:hypothetical protein
MPCYGLEIRLSGNLPILVSPSSKVNFSRQIKVRDNARPKPVQAPESMYQQLRPGSSLPTAGQLPEKVREIREQIDPTKQSGRVKQPTAKPGRQERYVRR